GGMSHLHSRLPNPLTVVIFVTVRTDSALAFGKIGKLVRRAQAGPGYTSVSVENLKCLPDGDEFHSHRDSRIGTLRVTTIMRLPEFLNEQRVPYEMMIHPPAYTSTKRARCLHVPGRRLAKTV